ncbi:MAG: AAA family ATPase [Terriglobia bacterium]
MYERFFNLREKPFSMMPDPAFLYFGDHHGVAYAVLEYGALSQAGFTVITGEVGCGKTTLVRHLLNQLPEPVSVGLITNTHLNFDNLLEWILMAFGQDYRPKSHVSLYDDFVSFLISQYAARRRTLLIIDEAQNLGVATLEELRTLSNVNADGHQVLRIILVGQPELRVTLTRPELRQLSQRVAAHYHLRPLSQSGTLSYIRYRLEHAGGSPDIFTNDACHQIHIHSGGVPRKINLLCDVALVYAYAEEEPVIEAGLIQAIIDEGAAGMISNPTIAPTEQSPPGAAVRSHGTGRDPVDVEPAVQLGWPDSARPLTGGRTDIQARSSTSASSGSRRGEAALPPESTGQRQSAEGAAASPTLGRSPEGDPGLKSGLSTPKATTAKKQPARSIIQRAMEGQGKH